MSDDTTAGLGYGGDMDPQPRPTIALDAADESGFSQSLLTFAAIMTFLIMIVGICGNFLTVVALLKCPKVRNVAAAFIISLCIADLLFCALVLPFQGLRFVQGTWRHGAVLCRLIPFIQYGNIGVSLLCIAMITINRYVMITHHGCYARIYKRHWIAVMIAACWLISYGMQLPTLLGAWGRFGYDDRLQTCSIMSDDHGHSSKTTLFITAFVIPCLVIIACYAKIFWVVHKSEQRLKRHANKQNSIPNNLRPVATATSLPTGGNAGDSQTQSQTATGAGGLPASRVSSDSSSSYSTDVPEAAIATGGGKQPAIRVKDQREVRAKRNEWRITKMVLAIFLSFVICYLPITIVKVADKDVDHPSWHIFSYIMLYLSACINPIIYVIMNKQYRKAYKTVVLCQPARLLLPFGKTNGGASSAAEMERYRIEQQPQPHHRLPDVGRRNSNGNGIGIGIGSGSNQHGADIRLPALCIAKVDTIAGANVKGPRSDKQNESADIGYAHINVHAHANDHVPAPAAIGHVGQRGGGQQPDAAAQEEQSLLHQQRLQQQREQQQQQREPEQRHLSARSWLNGQRLSAVAPHHNGRGRHHTGGGGTTRHAQSDSDFSPRESSSTATANSSASPRSQQRGSGGGGNGGEQSHEIAHLHERKQSEANAVL